ncbi:MAG TPA: hypothetical protein VGF94_17530 [Kofleriaceae bacterium]
MAIPYRETSVEPLRAAVGVLRRRNLVAVALAALPGVGAVAAFVWIAASGGPEPHWIQFLGIGVGASWLAVPSIWSLNAFAHARRGELLVDREGISIAGELVVPSALLESAVVARRGWRGARVVRMRRRGAWLDEELAAEHDAQAERVIELVGFGPADAPLVFVSPGRLFRYGIMPAFMVFAMFAALAALLPAVFISPPHHGELSPIGKLVGIAIGLAELIGFVALVRRTATRVTIGREGVVLRTTRGERAIVWRELAAVEPWEGQMTRYGRALPAGLDLVLADGERFRIYTARESYRVGTYDRDVVLARIRELKPDC